MSKKSKKKKKDNLLGSATVARNRKASFDFHLGKEFVAGIVLQGTEVKSVRNGQVQLKGAYAKVIDGEVFLFNCHIAEYAFGNRYNHEPLRAKKLLLNKDEISKLEQKIKLNNQTLVASKIFFKRNYAKVLLHLAEGKQKGDKREAIKKKDMQRELARDASNWA
jgi:SsrA-binding protein